MLEQDKEKMARLFDENRALKIKRLMLSGSTNWAAVRLMNKILILLIVVGYGIAGTEDYNYKCEKAHEHNRRNRAKLLPNYIA